MSRCATSVWCVCVVFMYVDIYRNVLYLYMYTHVLIGWKN